jgi:hypothetical protein
MAEKMENVSASDVWDYLSASMSEQVVDKLYGLYTPL